MGRLIKMEWDCPFCETKNISGTLRSCPNCGHPIGNNIKYHMPSDVQKSYISDEEAKHINKNPHWRCNFCDTYNSDSNSSCISCGAPRTSQSKNYFEIQEKTEHPEASESHAFYYEDSMHSNYTNYSSKLPNNDDLPKHFNLVSRFNLKIILIILLAILGFSGLIYLLVPKEKTMQVTDLSWERSIDIEHLETVDESGWSLPYGARLHYTKKEISKYEQVIDHYETKTRTVSEQVVDGYEEVVTGYRDLGNGYAEEITSKVPIYRTEYYEEEYEEPVYVQVPVYETKYYYEIDKWIYERSVITSGTSDAPYWGEIVLTDNERTAYKSEAYYVTGLIDQKQKTYSFSFDDWTQIHIGQEIRFNASLGHGKLIDEDS